MPATSLFHIAIKTGRPEATKRFYEQVFGMSESPRPPFEFPGYWMQLDTPHGGSIFHIYTGSAALGNDGRVPTGSGAIDHIALSAHGFGQKCVHLTSRHKARGALKKLFRRRNAIEPAISHDKQDHGLQRNHLKSEEGDRINDLSSR